MLKLLLDEHVSPSVAGGLKRKRPRLVVRWMSEWEGGRHLGSDDPVWLQAAAAQGLTVVTFDRRTIPPVLKAWAEQGRSHGGVIFVDHKTLPSSNIGGLVKALGEIAASGGEANWKDRVHYLMRANG